MAAGSTVGSAASGARMDHFEDHSGGDLANCTGLLDRQMTIARA